MSQTKKNQKKITKKFNIFKAIAIAVPILIVMVIIIVVLNNNKDKTSNLGLNSNKTDSVVVKDSDLNIKVSDISEKAKFYPVDIDGTKLEVIAVKAPDGTIRTAFNTCQVCFDSGKGYYVQEGDSLVCQNCGNKFTMDQVEVTKGGCNPVPISSADKSVDDTNILISKNFLIQSKTIFAKWKN